MKVDSHERARLLVDEALMARIPAEELNWLKRHTEECAACRDYYELSGRIIRGLRSLSFDADPETPARMMEGLSKYKAPLRMYRWILAAAAVFVIAAIPVLRYASELRRERADALFLESVDARLSRTVPAAMEPLIGSVR